MELFFNLAIAVTAGLIEWYLAMQNHPNKISKLSLHTVRKAEINNILILRFWSPSNKF